MRHFTKEECDLIASKFWARLPDGLTPDECWPFPGEPDRDGYKAFSVTINGVKERFRAHQIACLLAHGEAKPGQVVRHNCPVTTPSCVNPLHLSYGTHAENRMDTVARGLQAKGPVNGRTKLTEVQVERIIRMVIAGEFFSANAYARQWGVDPKAIRQIRDRQTWVYLWERIEAEIRIAHGIEVLESAAQGQLHEVLEEKQNNGRRNHKL